MNLKFLLIFFALLFLITVPMMVIAEVDKELLDMAQRMFQSKQIPCADNNRCYCLSLSTTTVLPLRYTKLQFCAKKMESGHVVDAEVTTWDDAGNKVDEGHFLNGKMSGQWISWHSNGTKAAEGNLRDGKHVGPFTTWHDNGQVEVQGCNNDEGNAHGEWLYWDKTGKLTKKLIWNNGKLISKQEIKP